MHQSPAYINAHSAVHNSGGTNSDSLISFDPATEQFTHYPLPTRVTYTREIDFDAEGGVWTSNSNFPTWQIEGPGPKLIRVQPAAAPASDIMASSDDRQPVH